MVTPEEEREAIQICDYERARNANVMVTEQRLQALRLRELAQEVTSAQQPNKKRKKMGSDATMQHNLRSSSRLSVARVDKEPRNGIVADSQPGSASSARGDLQRGNGSAASDEGMFVS